MRSNEKLRPTPAILWYTGNLLVAVALSEFSVQYENADPELAEHVWQLAADRLLEFGVGLVAVTSSSSNSYRSAVDCLEKTANGRPDGR